MEDNQFVQISHSMIDAMCNKDITGAQIKTLLQIMKHINNETGESHPSVAYLASKINADEKTVDRSIKALTDKEFITYKKGGFRANGNVANVYRVHQKYFIKKQNSKTTIDIDYEEFRRQLASGEMK